MIYELRLYAVEPGRMADVHARFNRHLGAPRAKTNQPRVSSSCDREGWLNFAECC